MMGFCSLANFAASLIERRVLTAPRPYFHFDRKVWTVLFCWAGAALLQYFLLIKVLSFMHNAGMSSLAWPMLIGVNVTVFSVFCRLKWKEKYPPAAVLGVVGCVFGIIMMIAGRK